jgi:DNA topoisomerase-1
VRDDIVSLHFPAKSGQEWRSEIADADLASVVQSLKRRGSNARLLAWRQGAKWHPVVAQEINAYVRERTGGEFTAKDFRTLHGTVVAAVSLAKHGSEPRKSARDRAIAQAMRDASAVLGNTPSIARKSYVDPRLIDRYTEHTTIDLRG